MVPGGFLEGPGSPGGAWGGLGAVLGAFKWPGRGLGGRLGGVWGVLGWASGGPGGSWVRSWKLLGAFSEGLKGSWHCFGRYTENIQKIIGFFQYRLKVFGCPRRALGGS